MSRLCRLKTKTHGEDRQWAYEEITKLREQVEAQAAEIKTLEIEFGDVRDSFLYYKEMTRAQAAVIESLKSALIKFGLHKLSCDYVEQHRGGRFEGSDGICDCGFSDALAIPTDSTQILDEVRKQEREKCANVCMSLCRVIEEPHEFERCAEAIRAME